MSELKPSHPDAQIISHLLADLIAEEEKALDAESIHRDLVDAVEALQQHSESIRVDTAAVAATADSITAKWTADTEQVGTATLKELFSTLDERTQTDIPTNPEIIDVETIRSRPSGLPAHGELTTLETDTAVKAVADFTTVPDVSQTIADALVEAGYETYEDIFDASLSELTDAAPLTKSLARDLQAEAQAHHGDIRSVIARESRQLAKAHPCNDDGTAVSHQITKINQPAGEPLSPEAVGNENHYNGLPVLDDATHPEIPSAPAQLQTTEAPNGLTHVENICRAWAAQKAVLLIGPPGTGKNTRFEDVCARTNRPTTELTFDEEMLPEDLLGIHKMTEEEIVFDPGPVPHRVKYGGAIIFNEINAASANTLKILHDILQNNAKLYVRGNNTVFTPHPQFTVGATANDQALGTNQMDGALVRRFIPLPVDRLAVQDEVDLLDGMVNGDREIVSRDNIEKLVHYANQMRDDARTQSRTPYPTTTDLENILLMSDGEGDLIGSLQMIYQGIQRATSSGRVTDSLDEDALQDIF